MSEIMRRTLRRSVLAAGGTLLAAAVSRNWLLDGAVAQPDPVQPPVQSLDVVRGHPPTILPPLTFTDADGAAVTLASYRGRGVLLNLWATWCVPCVAEMPSLDRLSRALVPSGIAVLTVSLDHGGASQVKPFFAAHGIRSLPVLLDPHSSSLSTLGLDGIPVTLLIDTAGREVARISGSVAWGDSDAVALVRRLTA